MALLAGLLGLAGSWWGNSNVYAQIDDFTFLIPYPTDLLDDQFDIANANNSFVDDDIITTISIAVQRAGTVIYYDHWEGVGVDGGLETFLTAPTQPSTEIWGDNDPSNGIPPGYTVDLFVAGDVVVLQNLVSLPRDPAVFFFDGGDKFTALGGAVAVTLTVWPQLSGSLFAGAWELYPTSRWDTLYRIPIGQDLAGSGPGQRNGFSVVGFNVQTLLPDTTLQIDLDGDGVVDITQVLPLGGQNFTQIDGVMTGARIDASTPVQVHVFAGNRSPGIDYEARAFTIPPSNNPSNDYVGPRSSDGDFWLYNSDQTLPLTVTVQTSSTLSSLVIPPGSTQRYPPTGPLLGPTGVRFTATDGRPFLALAALDQDFEQDWGYPLLPFRDLTTQTFIGWGAGNINIPPDSDESRLYVTAVETTTLFVDLDHNGTVDNTVVIPPLQEVPIIDPDHDLTRTFLYTDDGKPFVVVWGQDASAPVADPSIDVGTGIAPLPSLLLQKTVDGLTQNITCTGSVGPGDTITYKLAYFNNSLRPIPNILIKDNLPPEVTYVPGSTELAGVPLPDDSSGSPFRLDEGGYNLGTLNTFETNHLTFDVVVNDPTRFIVNRAQIESLDPPFASDTVATFTPLLTSTMPIYQIELTPADPAGTVTAGESITFNLTITNTSSITFTDFPVEDTFDQNFLTFQQAIPGPDHSEPGRIRWNDLTSTVGDIPPGGVVTASLIFSVTSTSTLTANLNSVAIGSDGRRSDGTLLPRCSAQASVNYVPAVPPPVPTIEPSPSPTSTSTSIPTLVPPPPPTVTATSTPEAPNPAPPESSPTPLPLPSPTATGTPPPITTVTPNASLTPSSDPPGANTTSTIPVALLPETGHPPAGPRPLWPIGLCLFGGMGLFGIMILGRRLSVSQVE